MRKTGCLIILILLFSATVSVYAQDFGTPTGTWHGYDQHDLTVARLATRVVAPDVPAEGNPWVIRALWPDVATDVDVELLSRGYHIVYMTSFDDVGSPVSVGEWDSLYSTMTTDYDLAEKAIVEGGSRGGLLAYNWAKQNTDKVQSIFGVVPVCDFKSWPGRWPDSYQWANVLRWYGFTQEEAMAYEGNPVDTLDSLAAADIRILHVAGDNDDSVRLEENSQLVYDRYTAMGGNMELFVVEGGTHASTWDTFVAQDSGNVDYIADFLMETEQTPEPATMCMLGLGAAALIRRRRS